MRNHPDRIGAVTRNRKGITLFELLVVIVILGIIAAVVIPRVGKGGLYNKYTVYTTTRQIGADMRLAQRLTITNGVNYRVKFFSVGGSGDYNEYRIQRRNNGGWDLVGEAKQIADDIIVTGDEEVEFSPTGSADSERNFNYGLGDYDYNINVRRATGRVKITEIW